MIENHICVGTDCLSAGLSSGLTSLLVKVCVWKKCQLKDQWISDIPVSCALSKYTDMQHANTSFRNILDSPHWPDSPFTQEITLLLLYCLSGLWALCQDVILLTYIASTKVGSCDLDLWHIIHILSFITPNFFPIYLMIMETLAIFQVWICVWVLIGKCQISSQIRHMVRLFEI